MAKDYEVELDAILDQGSRETSKETGSYDNQDIETLTCSWINERNAPELLAHQHDIVANLREMIEAQEHNIALIATNENNGMLVSIVAQQELERVKYVLRSYLRVRLSKVGPYSFRSRSLHSYYLPILWKPPNCPTTSWISLLRLKN